MNHPGESPHRRFNPLTGEWVLVSAHRTRRPWLGQQEQKTESTRLHQDPDCYLCPGNKRASSNVNPEYEGTYVFTNDYPALLPDTENLDHDNSSDLFRREDVYGTSRVICYSPRHDLTLPELPLADIQNVVKTWVSQTRELTREYKWIQIFENKGQVMGCSNPHPHGQIWAGNFIPTEIQKENSHQLEYFQKTHRPLLMDYVEKELKLAQRIVYKNDAWIALVPYWAVWPYEIIILPCYQISRMTDLKETGIDKLAELLKSVLTKYDHLFHVSFPYSMGWHGAPNGISGDHWQLHAHIYPPLLRSATVKKFLVGYEMLAEAQRDITPETAAEQLAGMPQTYL